MRLALLAALVACGGEYGERCTETSDCAGDLECLFQYCNWRCAPGDPCPDGYACAQPNQVCVATCLTDDDCPESLPRCTPELTCATPWVQ